MLAFAQDAAVDRGVGRKNDRTVHDEVIVPACREKRVIRAGQTMQLREHGARTLERDRDRKRKRDARTGLEAIAEM